MIDLHHKLKLFNLCSVVSVEEVSFEWKVYRVTDLVVGKWVPKGMDGLVN